jgi:eukaryotic-like serine/threonine-protein kinase
MGEPLVILDRYEVIRRLAIGGMGEIFLARQKGAKGFSRLVILKTLRPELAEQADALDQFLDEARVAALLNHPNVVAVYEVGLFKGVHFIAMEYIGGIDLAMLLRTSTQQQKRVPFRVAASIVRDGALGLDFAHHAVDDAGRSLKVVHRDVSPQNLMIRADGLVKVVDFGVAVASNQMHETQGDKLKGKIRYMSPEQLLGEELDGRSDQFSLGIVLWELLCGRPLFQGAGPVDIFQRVLQGDVPRPSTVIPEVPPLLEELVMKMLAKDRNARFPTCGQAANALRTWLDSTGGPSEVEVREFVQAIAGDMIADRVRDLTPRVVSIHGLGETPTPGHSAEGFTSVDTHAETRVVTPSKPDEQETKVAPKGMLASLASEGEAEHSDAGVLLDAVEHSGVLHGHRRFITCLVGVLPGWAALASQIANVPMGAFGVNRLKNIFFRQLTTMAQEKKGTIIRRGPDSFVIAFGIEQPDQSDALHALQTAFSVQKVLDDLAKDPRQRLTAHMGVAAGVALATEADAGPVQIAGSVVERAEQLAGLARQATKGVLVSAQIAELTRGSAQIVATDGLSIGGEPVHEATGPLVVNAPGITRKKILIADDAEVFRRIEEEILRPFAYAFVHAKNGAEAIRLAVDEKPDLILLDIQMPVMDGVQVLGFLKKNAASSHIPIVVVTTIGRAHDEDLMRRGGADAFLTKPVKPGVLISTVRKLLGEQTQA